MIRNLLHKYFFCAVEVFGICLALYVPFNLKSFGPTRFLVVHKAHAESSSIPSGWESYLNRPDILEVPSHEQSLDLSEQKLKAAHFSFIAQLLETYPAETHLYFLARDSEYLYDVARLVTAGTSDAARIHLINVSRANMRDPNLKSYLKDNGISEGNTRPGSESSFR